MKKYIIVLLLCAAFLAAEQSEDYLVGVHYYVWYTHAAWDNINAEPLLGDYASHERDVIDQHIIWASEHDIDFFGIGWSGAGKAGDKVIKRYFLRSPEIQRTRFCIAYDTQTRFAAFGEPPFDFSDPEFAEKFIEDFDYLARTYFDHPQYLKFDGRPVVWMYIARGQKGDWIGVLEKARATVRKHGYELYLDGDLLWPDKTDEERIKYFDAASLYILNQRRLFERHNVTHTGQVADLAERYYRQWATSVPKIRNLYTGKSVPFHPVITPQFEKPAYADSLRYTLRTEEDFRRMAEVAKTYASLNSAAGAKVIWVTSWNEWYESTSIEPTYNGPVLSKNYGFKLLQIIRDVF